jgi:pimeloyl-ACP methyl ester carboxylesterase
VPLLFDSAIEPPVLLSQSSGSDAYVWLNGEELFVSFRGTVDFRDFITDADVRMARPFAGESDVLLHSGFLARYESVIPRIADVARDLRLRHLINTVTFTGHSLGGALATIAAMQPEIVLPVSTGCKLTTNLHTFGAPRVGDRCFSDRLASVPGLCDAIRVAHMHDIVPCFPFSQNFTHNVGTALILDDDANLVESKSADDGDWWHRFDSTARGVISGDFMSNHECELYVSLMIRSAMMNNEPNV